MSSRKRELLFLCHTLPYPPDGGVWIRTYNVLRELAAEFQVTLLCFERLGTAKQTIDAEDSLRHLRSLADVALFQIPQNRSRAIYLWNHLRSILFRRVYTRYLYESEHYRSHLSEVLAAREFEIVHVDSMDLSGYLDALGELPVVCVHHNVESELLRRRSAVEGGLFKAAYVRFQSRLMQREEQKWCPRVALNVLCSGFDLQFLKKSVPGAVAAVVPNGVDIEEYQPSAGEKSGASFVGATSWFPNLDALEHFANDVLPFLRQEIPDYQVSWVGSATDEQRRRFGALGIHLTGYVEDVKPYMAASSTFIVPLRVGGGTRLKILNAWSMGCAVISSSVGCEGLEARDGENIIIRDDPAEFARSMLDVERDPELRDRLGGVARRTAEAVYSWPVIGRDMVRRYQEAMSAAKTGSK